MGEDGGVSGRVGEGGGMSGWRLERRRDVGGGLERWRMECIDHEVER